MCTVFHSFSVPSESFTERLITLWQVISPHTNIWNKRNSCRAYGWHSSRIKAFTTFRASNLVQNDGTFIIWFGCIEHFAENVHRSYFWCCNIESYPKLYIYNNICLYKVLQLQTQIVFVDRNFVACVVIMFMRIQWIQFHWKKDTMKWPNQIHANEMKTTTTTTKNNDKEYSTFGFSSVV